MQKNLGRGPTRTTILLFQNEADCNEDTTEKGKKKIKRIIVQIMLFFYGKQRVFCFNIHIHTFLWSIFKTFPARRWQKRNEDKKISNSLINLYNVVQLKIVKNKKKKNKYFGLKHSPLSSLKKYFYFFYFINLIKESTFVKFIWLNALFIDCQKAYRSAIKCILEDSFSHNSL